MLSLGEVHAIKVRRATGIEPPTCGENKDRHWINITSRYQSSLVLGEVGHFSCFLLSGLLSLGSRARRAPRSISGRGYMCPSAADGMGNFSSAPNLRQLIISHKHMQYLEKRLTGRTEGRLCPKWSHLLAFCFFYNSESIKPCFLSNLICFFYFIWMSGVQTTACKTLLVLLYEWCYLNMKSLQFQQSAVWTSKHSHTDTVTYSTYVRNGMCPSHSGLNTAAAAQYDISQGPSVIRSNVLPLLLARIITHMSFTLIAAPPQMTRRQHTGARELADTSQHFHSCV